MTDQQQAIRQAAAACDALQQSRDSVNFHDMQRKVQAAQNLGASLHDIRAARTS